MADLTEKTVSELTDAIKQLNKNISDKNNSNLYKEGVKGKQSWKNDQASYLSQRASSLADAFSENERIVRDHGARLSLLTSEEVEEYRKALSSLSETSKDMVKFSAIVSKAEIDFAKSQAEVGKLSEAVSESLKQVSEDLAKAKEKRDAALRDLEIRRQDTNMSDFDYENARQDILDIFTKESAEAKSKGPSNKDILSGALDQGMKGISDFFDQKLFTVNGLPSIVTQAVEKVPQLKVIIALLKISNAIGQQLSKGMDEAISIQNQYLTTLDTRLQGTNEALDLNFHGIFERITTFSDSRYVSMKELTKNVAKLTESGIAYNLEQRALLETIKDKMVTTFDSMQGQLDRLIRIQQADVTQQKMGAEIRLNELFNSMFSDTSYLSDVYDEVSAALIDATSSKSFSEAVEIDFAVQKWLGALYSLGMSSSAVTGIAQGLTSLATGDINQLNGTPMGNLFALSSRNAGVSYTDMLTNGLDASNINELMKSMVEYLQQVAENTSGNVAKSAILSNIGGNLSFSDIKAISNLSPDEIARIYLEQQTYNSLGDRFNTQLSTIDQRTATFNKFSTLKENMLLNAGWNLIDSGEFEAIANYLLYDVVGKSGGLVGMIANAVGNLLNIPTIASMLADAFMGYNDIHWESKIQDYLRNNFSESNVRGGYIPFSSVASGEAISTVSSSSRYAGPNFTGTGTHFEPVGPGEIGNFSGTARKEASLYEQANSTTLSASNTTGTASKIRDVGDIYAELFENQTKPIRVAVAKLEEEAINNLNIGPGGMLVDIQDNDVNTLISQVYRVRSAY